MLPHRLQQHASQNTGSGAFFVIAIAFTLAAGTFLSVTAAFAAGTVQGTITEVNGTTTVANAWVTVHDPNWTFSRSVQTSANGSYTIADVPAGTQRAVLWAHHATQHDPAEAEIAVLDGQTTTFNASLLQRNVSFTLTEPDGVTPISNGFVWVATSDYGSTYRWYSTAADGSGGFALTTNGTYTLQVDVNHPTYSDPANSTFTFSGSAVNLGVIRLRVPAARVKVLTPDGSPAQNANVSVHDASYTSERTQWATTNAEGIATVGALPSGSYLIDVTPPSGNGTTYVAPDQVSYTHTDGTTNTTYLDSPLRLATPLKTIRGRVRFPDGTPVADASYNAWQLNGGGSFSGQVGADGTFTATVGRGSFEISIGSQSRGTWGYPGQPQRVRFEGPNTVAETAEVTFEVLRFTATIRGRILDPDGMVIGGMVGVSVWAGSIGNSVDASQTDGSFSVAVAAGTYRVDFWGPNIMNWGAPNLGSVTVEENGTVNLGDLRMLRRDATIVGRITDRNGVGLANMNVSAWGVRSSGWGWATTDANGNYSMNVIGNVEYEVTASPAWGGNNTQRYLNTQAPVRKTVASGGTETVNWRFEVADARIQGRLVDRSGTTLTSLYGWMEGRVAGVDAGERWWGGIGAQITAGQFSLDVVGGLGWDITPWLGPDANYTVASVGVVSSQATVNIPAGATVSNVVVTLVPNDVTVEGRLVDEDGNPASGMSGAMVFAENGRNGYQWATVNAEGRYTLRIAEGEWRISYSLPGDGDYLVSEVSAIERTFQANEQVTLNLEVRRADATIRVTVLDPQGDAVPNAWIDVATNIAGRTIDRNSPFGRYDRGNFTDQNGQASVRVPGDFRYYVSAHVPASFGWVAPDVLSVTPTATGPVAATLRFREPNVTVSGRLSLDGSGAVGLVWAWSEDGQSTQTTTDANGAYTLQVLSGTTWHIGGEYDSEAASYSTETFERTPASGESLTLDLPLLPSTAMALPDTASRTFDAETTTSIRVGGDAGLTLTAPARSTTSDRDQDVSLTVIPTGEVPSQAGDEPFDLAYNVEGRSATGQNAGQEITDLDGNVTLQFCYEESELPEGRDEADITAGYFDEAADLWRPMENIVVDADANCVTATTDHFTLFSLLAPNGSDTGTVNDAPSDAPGDGGDGGNGGNGRDGGGDDDPGTVTTAVPREIVVLPRLGGGMQIRVFARDGSLLASFFPFGAALRGQLVTAIADFTGDGEDEIAVSAGVGHGAQVRIFSKRGVLLEQFFAYDRGFRRGIALAAGDLTGDSAAELIVSPIGGAKTNLRVYQYQTATRRWTLLDWVWAFGASYTPTASVVIGDLTGDGAAEIVLAVNAAGGPQVRVYRYVSGDGLVLDGSFFPYATNARHGVRVTLGDLTGDGVQDIVTVPSGTAGGHVRAYAYAGSNTFRHLASVHPYGQTFRGTLSVKLTNLDGIGTKELIVIPNDGATNLRAYRYDTAAGAFTLAAWTLTHGSAFRGGGELTVADTNRNGLPEIAVVPAAGGGPTLRLYEYDLSQNTFRIVDTIVTHEATVRGGTTVTAADLDADGASELIVGADGSDRRAGPNVRVYSNVGGELTLDTWFWAFDPAFRGGVVLRTLQ